VTRRLLYDVLLFLLPFAVYGIYWQLSGRTARKHPWSALFIIGLVLVVLSFVWWALAEGEPPEGVYVPPHVEDGHIVPGHVEPAH
jgi:phosphoglycerol transferase MdoB-like AlkP superfamily enzyme